MSDDFRNRLKAAQQQREEKELQRAIENERAEKQRLDIDALVEEYDAVLLKVRDSLSSQIVEAGLEVKFWKGDDPALHHDYAFESRYVRPLGANVNSACLSIFDPKPSGLYSGGRPYINVVFWIKSRRTRERAYYDTSWHDGSPSPDLKIKGGLSPSELAPKLEEAIREAILLYSSVEPFYWWGPGRRTRW